MQNRTFLGICKQCDPDELFGHEEETERGRAALKARDSLCFNETSRPPFYLDFPRLGIDQFTSF